MQTNRRLSAVIQSLPLQVAVPSPVPLTAVTSNTATLQTQSSQVTSPGPRRDIGLSESPDRLSNVLAAGLPAGPLSGGDPLDSGSAVPAGSTSLKVKATSPVAVSEPATPAASEFPPVVKTVARTRPQSPVQQQAQQQAIQMHSQPQSHSPVLTGVEPELDEDPFDVRETVNMLTLQFLSDHPETRIAALEWLLMLHLKAPTKILSRDSGTFPALLKTLSDPSEDVVKHDLQLLAQISSSSEDSYFRSFMVNVLELFSTDRRLLETRGSLIIRQLCLHLNAEKIFRTLAEILEKDDVG